MAMNRVSVLASLLLSSLALGGCGAVAGRARENGSEGWVSRVLTGSEAVRLQADCAGADLSAYPADRFVLVREQHGRHSVSVVAHAPPELQVEVGDEVEIVPARCSKDVMPEVKQVFRQ
jgi:hypothetical protein